jgi:hypothetical protein
MECTVMADRYLALGNGRDGIGPLCQPQQACFSVGGSFTTLWHNTVFESQDTRKLYQALLGRMNPTKP